MQDRVVELARDLQRPERRALRDQAVDVGRRRCFRRLDRDGGDALRAVDIDADKAVADAGFIDGALERRQRNALAVAVALRGGGEFLCPLGDLGFQLAVRHDLVDQAPCDGALALDAFLDGAEIIGVVAAHLALVDDARQPAGARQHRQQRHFRQRHRRRAVVGEHDVIGRERQLIAAAGRGAIDDGDEALPGIFGEVFQAVAGLVGEFAEIDFVGVGRARQHADVGAGAEHAVLARAHQYDLYFRMLEAQPLHRVGQFDVDAEIVGIEFELIALEQPGILVDVHGQRRNVARRHRASNAGSATDRFENRCTSRLPRGRDLHPPWATLVGLLLVFCLSVFGLYLETYAQ